MADLYNEFAIFHDRIAPSSTKKAFLWAERNAIRQRIRDYFQVFLNLPIPRFRSQGSYALDTMVNPIDGEYCIDDSVYLQHLNKHDDNNWPSALSVHRWLINAAGDHAVEWPIDKPRCVRVRYAEEYRINMFCYGELNGRYLLVNNKTPKQFYTDPFVFTKYFRSHVHLHGEQLIRIIRFIKAWADFQSLNKGKMLSGFILTVLAISHFQGYLRDDVALAKTLQSISNALNIVFMVLNPISISEELTAEINDVQKQRFLEAVNASTEDAIKAITMKDCHEASILWRKQFGDRFPIVEKKSKRE